MSRIQNVFKTILAAFFALALADCGRCMVQGPFCTQAGLRQTMVDMDINDSPGYMSSYQRQTACLSLASNLTADQVWIVATNWVITNTNGIWSTNTLVVTNLYTNNIFLPIDQNGLRAGWSPRENSLNTKYYGQDCRVIWQ